MKLNLFLLLHLTGLIPVSVRILRHVPHKYVLIMTPASWTDAQNFCREMNTDLVTIQSDNDWLLLSEKVESEALTSPAWIGLFININGWYWSFSDVIIEGDPFTDWNPGQPDNYPGTRACVLIDSRWSDTTCSEVKPFICYDATFGGSEKFIGISSPLAWFDAQTYCRTHYTDLASAFNSSDNNILAQISSTQGDSWIGLSRNSWQWSDGTAVSNLAWASGQPDNFDGNEYCAVVYNGQLRNEPCIDPHYFICYTLTKGKIMRVEVKSDGSVFDPSVQSFMLEKIQTKLEEKGMLNVTASWRVHPDENIFHKKKKTKDEL